LGKATARDSDAIVGTLTRRGTAQKYNLTSIGDLANKPPQQRDELPDAIEA